MYFTKKNFIMAKREKYIIRNMTNEEFQKIAIEWAASEGWNPGLYEHEAFFATDPEGYFVGLLNGKPISCISAVAYNDNFGFMGFYIVMPKHRGKGYGIQIWDHAINYLGNRNIGLDGVIAQQENYEKSGFKLAYRNIRYAVKANPQKIHFRDIIKISSLPFNNIAEYDSKIFPAGREEFLKLWLTQKQSYSVAATQRGKVLGYGTIRNCRDGYKIGPLFADEYDIACDIYQALLEYTVAGLNVFLDIPEVNDDAMEIAERYKMEKTFETVRMYTKNAPQIELDKVYGVTSFELG